MVRNGFVRLGAAVLAAVGLVAVSAAAGATVEEPQPDPGSTQVAEAEPAFSEGEGSGDGSEEGAVLPVDAALPAGAGGSHTITNAEVCSDYFNEGVVTINMADFANFDALVVGDGGTVSCVAEVTAVLFRGEGPTSLTIGDSAFYQNMVGDADNTLASVVFPNGLTRLTVGEHAFRQESKGSEGNALALVKFPDRLSSLTMGQKAFAQYARGGNNALASVVFPEGLESLTIPSMAFNQYAVWDNALASVVFPEGLTYLAVEYSAFGQWANGPGSTALASVVFPTKPKDIRIETEGFYQKSLAGTVSKTLMFFPFDQKHLLLGSFIAKYATVEDAVWVWFGGDEVSIDRALANRGGGEYYLRGTRVAQFNANGGSLISSPDKLYVYPALGDEQQAVAYADVPTLDPTAFLGSDIKFLVTTPDVVSETPSEVEFTGWCQGEWKCGECTGGLVDGGVTVELSNIGTTQFSAGWKELSPKQFKVRFDLEGGEGTFPDIVGLEGEQVTLPATVPARPGSTFMGWADGSDVYQPGDLFTIPGEDVTLFAMWRYELGDGEGAQSGYWTVGGGASGGFGGGLARTGANVLPFAALGFGLLAGGVALVAVRVHLRKRM